MQRFLERATNFFDIPLDIRSRVLVLVAGLLLLPTFFTPIWKITFQSPRYPDGLTLKVYAHTMEGGRQNDLLEINALNYYLGMRSLDEERFLFVVQETPMFALDVIRSYSDRLRRLKRSL